jgi:hypothetical protein
VVGWRVVGETEAAPRAATRLPSAEIATVSFARFNG